MECLAKRIPVTVVYDSSKVKCEAACGLDWTSAETVAMIKQRTKDRFGNTAILEILDLSSGDKRVPELKERIRRNNLSLPLLLVNNEVRISGEFDARQLMDAIEVEKEIFD
jgi:hypothetical protein